MKEIVLLGVALVAAMLAYRASGGVSGQRVPPVCDWCHGTGCLLVTSVRCGAVVSGYENCPQCGGDGVVIE